jgi:hypothetical protein
MSLKKMEKPQNALFTRISPINIDSQKTPAECRLLSGHPHTFLNISIQLIFGNEFSGLKRFKLENIFIKS